MEFIGPVLIGLLIGVPLGILIGAALLRLAVKIVTKSTMPFGQACLSVFVVTLVTVVLGYLIGFIVGLAHGPALAAGILSYVINFLVAAGIYGGMVKQPESDQGIGFGKGMLVNLVLFLISLAIGLVFFGIFAVLVR